MICYLIRHGQDDDSVRGGWSDCPLTQIGMQQSIELADNLSSNFEYYNIGKIFSSDIVRAKQTATIIAEKINLSVELMPEFREVNNGVLAGMDNYIAEKNYPNMYWLVDLRSGKVTRDIRPTEVTTEAEQAAYDAAIARCTQGVTVLERLESEDCTVLYTAAGASGGEFRSLTLVYKPGSTKGAGETVNVGLPQISDTAQAAPEGMAISADGKTLTFTCTVKQSSTGQETGTYHYTISLDTGSIGFEVTP